MKRGDRKAWNSNAAQQLVRYEALFELLEDIQGVEDIETLSKRVAVKWKYSSRVTNWRLIVFAKYYTVVIDADRGNSYVQETVSLSEWDAYHHTRGVPASIEVEKGWEGPAPPAHLLGDGVKEIRVFPFRQAESWVGLLSVASRNEMFSDLDIKFIRFFGRYFTDRVSEISSRARETELLKEKAYRDSLTGLSNRWFILERLREMLSHAQRTGETLSVLLADIDSFKSINDTFGHQVGDQVLCEISRRLQHEIRGTDIVGRYGGEEFLCILYACDADETLSIAERFRKAISDTQVKIDDGKKQSITVTISIGASCTSQIEELNINTLIRLADDALYQSKARGKNCVTLAQVCT